MDAYKAEGDMSRLGGQALAALTVASPVATGISFNSSSNGTAPGLPDRSHNQQNRYEQKQLPHTY